VEQLRELIANGLHLCFSIARDGGGFVLDATAPFREPVGAGVFEADRVHGPDMVPSSPYTMAAMTRTSSRNDDRSTP